MIRKEIFLLVLPFISPCLSADEDYDVLSRDPYQYQFKVDDPKTGSRYEIAESGSPEIVRGSYRVDLPDGRTQIVTYEVHPDKGFDAKVTYEGTAQYPDTPDFVPSAYGPPEPIRPGYAKYKRQSQIKPERKKIGNKVREQRKAKTIAVKKEAIPSTDLLTASSEKLHFPNQKIEVANFDDTEDSPQAEPLSLQQNSKPSTKKRQNRPATILKEYTDEEMIAKELETPKDTTMSSAHFTISPSLVIHEAVPTSSKIPEVYQINYVSGYNGQSFASPRNAFDELADAVFSESVQNPQVINLETTASEKAVLETRPVIFYPKAAIDHEVFKAPQPVASGNEFLNNQHHNVGVPHDTFVEASDTKDNFSIHKVKSPTVYEKLVAETEDKISQRKKLLDPKHMKEPQTFSSKKFESPTAAIVDLSDDTLKNHKKRKVDVKDYYKDKESIGQKPIRNIDFLPVQSVNLLPTIYRSQIKFIPLGSKSESDETQKKFDPETSKDNESVKTNVEILAVAETIKRKEQTKLEKTSFQTEIFRDHSSTKTGKPDHKREEITKNSENESYQADIKSSWNEFTNLNHNKEGLFIKNMGNPQEEELYQTIFDENPPVTTRRPKYKIIRKPRIPKQLAPQAIVYQPARRNDNIKLVYKGEGFVPEYVPRY